MTTLRRAALAFLLLPSALAWGTDPVPAPARSLEAQLAGLTTDRLFKTADVAVQVVNVRTGEEVFGWQADKALGPASTMKAITAAAALHALGPSYKFSTTLYRDGDIDAAGVLKGDLYVKGQGDPTFVVEKMWKMIHDLELEGVTSIAGDVIYDESYFDTEYQLPGWDKDEDIERGPSYFTPESALSVNYNTLTLVVTPGPEVGADALVRLETSAEGYVLIEGKVRTGAARSSNSVSIKRDIEDPEQMKLEVSGSVPFDGGTKKFYRSVGEPTAHFAAAFKELLAAEGITVSGGHKRGVTPGSAKQILSVQSPGLGAILMDMNKYSNNFIAEQVVKAMGAEVYGAPGTTEKGLRVIRDYLATLGIAAESYTIVNGSGLTRDAHVPPSLMTAMLVDMAHNPRIGHEFAASLAIGGQDGTLWSRFRKNPGQLRGKTGTIDGIHCLTGYIEGGDGEPYAFSFLVNDVSTISSVKDLHDRFAREMFSLEGEQPQLVDRGED